MREEIITGLGQVLRDVDPSNAGQMAEAETLASAAMASAMHFLQRRFGKDGAALAINSMFEHIASIVPSEGQPEPVGSTIPALHPASRKNELGIIQERAEAMFGYLKGRAGAEADVEAKASVWAATGYLRQREGEQAALDFLSFIRSKVGRLGHFEQLPVASQTRH